MTTVFGSTHVVEQLSFSMFPSTLSFDFDLWLESFLIFWALMGYFWGWGRVRKLFWGLLMYLLTLFFYGSIKSGIDFYLILGSFFTFWALMGYFWGWGRVRQLFWGLLM